MFAAILAPQILALSVAQTPVAATPGRSFGPLALGMTAAQVKATGLPLKPGRFEGEQGVGGFWVRMAGGKVTSISLDFAKGAPAPIKVGKHTTTADSAQAIAKAAAGCGPLQRRTGGNVIECTSGLVVAQHLGGVTVTVEAAATQSDAPTCADYLVPGDPASKIDVQPQKSYCLPARVVTAKTVEKDVLGTLRYNTCKTQRNRGATVVTCPFQGTRFIFAGPYGALHRVEGVPFER